MNPQLIIAALIAVAGFGTAWKVQDWRYNAKEKERAEQQLEKERIAAKAAIRRAEAVIEAQNAATNRERDLRGAAAGARAALVGLSDATDTAMRGAAASHAACLERTDTLGELLGTVAQAGAGMAEKADRHASDAQTLTDAWPTYNLPKE